MKSIVLLGGFLAIAQADSAVSISTSDAIDYARMIARDEGYDVSNTKRYTFGQLTGPRDRPFKHGYTAISFEIDRHPGNLILINNSTGQSIDFNTCDMFDYPDLRKFQDEIMSITKVKRKTSGELAEAVGCSPPKPLTQPTAVVR